MVGGLVALVNRLFLQSVVDRVTQSIYDDCILDRHPSARKRNSNPTMPVSLSFTNQPSPT